MSAHNWLRGGSPFTVEMFLLLNAHPHPNFCKGLRWALVQISCRLLFAIAAAMGPCWDQSFLLLSSSYKLRDRFTIWRKRTEQDCKKGNIYFPLYICKMTTESESLWNIWELNSDVPRPVFNHKISFLCSFVFTAWLGWEWNKLWSYFGCVWQLFHELPSVCVSLCPWSPFPYIEISLLQNFSAPVTNKVVLKNDKWQIK